MSGGKKTLNVFGIIGASILSVILAILLSLSPIAFSALSLLKPENLADTITNVDFSQSIVDSGNMNPENSTPESKENEALSKLLATNAAKEVLELYATDFKNTLSGSNAEKQLTEEKLKSIVENNIDEIAAFVKENTEEEITISDQEFNKKLKEEINKQIPELINSLPKPEELKEEVGESNPIANTLLSVVGKSGTITLVLLGTIIVISGLIFVFRLFDFRGFKWLTINLFIGSTVSAIICVLVALGKGFIEDAFKTGFAGGILGSFISTLETGLIVRTVIMLVCSVGLLLAYIFINKKPKTEKLEIENRVL